MQENKQILTVGTNKRNLELLGDFLRQNGYSSIPFCSIEQIDEAIEKGTNAALALIDIGGFDNSIWDICKRLHDKNIPSLVISPKQSEIITKESISYKAQGVLVKPLLMRELLTLIKKLIEE